MKKVLTIIFFISNFFFYRNIQALLVPVKEVSLDKEIYTIVKYEKGSQLGLMKALKKVKEYAGSKGVNSTGDIAVYLDMPKDLEFSVSPFKKYEVNLGVITEKEEAVDKPHFCHVIPKGRYLYSGYKGSIMLAAMKVSGALRDYVKENKINIKGEYIEIVREIDGDTFYEAYVAIKKE